MVNVPELPAIPYPFADAINKGDDFPTDGDMLTISYKKGIPAGYSIPNKNGGSRLTIEEMNRMFNIATAGYFAMQCGIPVTFSRAVSEKIGGYPRGAILKYISPYRGSIEDVISLRDDNKVDFRDEPKQYEPHINYNVGDHVYWNPLVSGMWVQDIGWTQWHDNPYSEIYKCTKAVTAEDNTDWENVEDSFAVDKDYEVSPGGPDGTNWAYVHKFNENFWPDYNNFNPNAPSWAHETKEEQTYENKVMSKTGWLYIRLVRKEKVDSIIRANSLESAMKTKIGIGIKTLYDDQVVKETFYLSLGLLAENSMMIPMVEGTKYNIIVTNPVGESIKVSAWELGTTI